MQIERRTAVKTKIVVLVLVVKEDDGHFAVMVIRYDGKHMEFTMSRYEHSSPESRCRLLDCLFAMSPDKLLIERSDDNKVYYFSTHEIGRVFAGHVRATRDAKKTRHIAAITFTGGASFVRLDRTRAAFYAKYYDNISDPSKRRLAAALNKLRDDFDVLFTPELDWGAFNKLGEITLRGLR